MSTGSRKRKLAAPIAIGSLRPSLSCVPDTVLGLIASFLPIPQVAVSLRFFLALVFLAKLTLATSSLVNTASGAAGRKPENARPGLLRAAG